LDLDLPMMAYAYLNGSTSRINGFASATGADALPNYSGSFCRANAENIVRLPSRDLPTIVARINALTAGGNTSITLGMKLDMTLLEP
jgi:hypothetical protein